jgi:NTE family protein
MKIGLALSGGGFRATVFHLGVLARLAEENRLEEASFLSTVSGGSLCIGLVLAVNGFQWPTSKQYLEIVVPAARKTLTAQGLQHGVIQRLLRAPLSIFKSRAAVISDLMRTQWGVTAQLSELPAQPRWMINATCYETGRNWRFERFRMGDYVFGYSNNTKIPLSDAMAASAGFPGLIGSLALDTTSASWFKYLEGQGGATELPETDSGTLRKTEPVDPAFPQVHLWDGGVYDNLGLESLHNFITGWRQNVDFLIVSDASGKPGKEVFRPGSRALLRIINILMDQVRSLRSRAVIEWMVNHAGPGSFLQTGNTCAQVLRAAGKAAEIAALEPQTLPAEEARKAAEMATVIRKLTAEEFERLFRHGFEVADYTLYSYHDDQFKFIGFSNSRWG